MSRTKRILGSITVLALGVGLSGCGVMETLVLDPARVAAQGAVGELVGGVVEGAVNDVLGSDPLQLFGPLLDGTRPDGL